MGTMAGVRILSPTETMVLCRDGNLDTAFVAHRGRRYTIIDNAPAGGESTDYWSSVLMVISITLSLSLLKMSNVLMSYNSVKRNMNVDEI